MKRGALEMKRQIGGRPSASLSSGQLPEVFSSLDAKQASSVSHEIDLSNKLLKFIIARFQDNQ